MHVISSNLHSVMNSLYAKASLLEKVHYHDLEELAEILSQEKNEGLREEVRKNALKHGMYEIDDHSGTNITVQIFDCEKIDPHYLPKEIDWVKSPGELCPLILVMDYAFGEQAYETMDEY